MNKIRHLFWNSEEHRLRLAWRLICQLAVTFFLLMVSQLIPLLALESTSSLVSDPVTLQQLTDPGTGPGQLLLTASAAAVTASVWFAGRFFDRRRFRDFGFRLSRSWWIDFGFGLGLGAALMALIFLVELAAGWIRVVGVALAPEEPGSFGLSLAAALGFFILIGFYEELYSRGYLIKNISEGLSRLFPSPAVGVWIATAVSALVFGYLHAANPNSSLSSTLNISLAGFFLASGYLLTAELAIPIGLHISWNFFQGSIFGFPVSGLRFGGGSLLTIRQLGPATWTGGEFGPEAGLLGAAAMLAGIGLTAAWIKRRKGKIRIQRSLADYQPRSGTGSRDSAPLSPSATKPDPDPTQFELVIWDWNGTLLDDLHLCLRTINQLLAARNLPPVDQERYLDIFGFPVRDYYQQLGFDFSEEPFETVSTEFITAYEQGRPGCQLMPGAESALASAADLEIPQAIISASKMDYLTKAVQEYGIAPYFLDVLGLDNHHAAGKMRLAADFLRRGQWNPERVLMIGDTTHDAEIALSLGLNCLLVPRGHHSRQRLEGTEASVISSLLEVPRYLQQGIHEH